MPWRFTQVRTIHCYLPRAWPRTTKLANRYAVRPHTLCFRQPYNATSRLLEYPKEGVFQDHSNRSSRSSDRMYDSLRSTSTFQDVPPLQPFAYHFRWLRRAVAILVAGCAFAYGAYCVQAVSSFCRSALEPESAEDNERLAQLNAELSTHPLVQQLRSEKVPSSSKAAQAPAWHEWPAYHALRSPSSAIASPERRRNTLATGPYAGSAGLAAQTVFYNASTQTLILFVNFGPGTYGWPGMVHGGAIATVLDEGLGRVALRSTAERAAVTASLEIEYRAPVKANKWYVLYARLGEDDLMPEWGEKSANGGLSVRKTQRTSFTTPERLEHQPSPKRSRKRHVIGWLGCMGNASPAFIDAEPNALLHPAEGETEETQAHKIDIHVHAVARGLFVVPKGMELPTAGVKVQAIDDEY